MDRLYENEKTNPATWGTATLLMEMQDPKRGQPKPPPKEKKAPPKAAAKPAEPTSSTEKSAPKPKPANEGASAEKPVEKPIPAADDDFKEEMTSCETPSSKRSTPPSEEPKP